MTVTYINNPPSWCKDAIPSAKGWIDNKTGELLISNRSINPELYRTVEKAIENNKTKVIQPQSTVKKKVTKKKVTQRKTSSTK